MYGTKIKLEKELFERCKRYAEEAGYSSLEEFIAHTLEKELRSKDQQSGDDPGEVARKLKGLGYIE